VSGVPSCFNFYSNERLHQALNYHTSRQVFEETMSSTKLRRGIKTAGAELQSDGNYAALN